MRNLVPTVPGSIAITLASGGDTGPAANTTARANGSRRHRLWELDGHAHCPVLGVCLPIAALRMLVDKLPAATP